LRGKKNLKLNVTFSFQLYSLISNYYYISASLLNYIFFVTTNINKTIFIVESDYFLHRHLIINTFDVFYEVFYEGSFSVCKFSFSVSIISLNVGVCKVKTKSKPKPNIGFGFVP